jgi:hypothetical protein
MAYLPLSTSNLPSPVIDPAQGASPEDHFNTVLYTGTGATQSITGVGHDPDFVWIKKRSGADNHELTDRLRGDERRLFSSSTNAEVAGGVSLATDGFNLLGTYGTSNESGFTYVAWNWKANGSGVTNTDGSITSTVSANTTSGFSIVDLTDPNTGASYEVGHGLDSAPEMFFIKKTNTTSDWSVYHKDVGNDRRLVLNSTDGQSGASSVYFGSTTPTSTVVTIGSGLSTGDNWIMYCFHSVDGFSKFGSYVGNGSADGPFVYTGFRPAFVMIKRTNATENWCIYDTARDTYNVTTKQLYPDQSYTEDSGSGKEIDLLSNGFKPKNINNRINGSGSTYIYMAFAEDGGPFKYSLAR